MQGHDSGPSSFGHSFIYIGITILSFFEDSEWMDLVSRESQINNLTDDTLVQRALISRYQCISQQPQKHSTPDTTPHPIGKAPASGIVPSSASLVSVYGFLLVLILGSEYGIIGMVKRDGWHTWEPTLLDEISIARASQVSMNVSIDENFPCSMSRNWVVVLSSTNEAGSMIQSRTHPRWMHTYAINSWAIPTPASFQKIQSQCSAVDLRPVLWSNWEWLGQRSTSTQKSGVSVDASFSSSSEARSRVRLSRCW